MWYKNVAGRFFGLVTKHACDRRTDVSRTELRLPRRWDGSGISWTMCKSFALYRDNHARISLLNFYRPDALPDAQPTCSIKALKAKTKFKKNTKIHTEFKQPAGNDWKLKRTVIN